MLDVTLDLPIRMAVLVFAGLVNDEAGEGFRELEACGRAYRERFAADETPAPGAIPEVQHARELFRSLHIDPTKRRPSSEALLNRALKGKPMPRINTLVDVGNWCSLDALLPLGLYDLDHIHGPVVLRRGHEGESYVTIAERELRLANRYLLADDEGPFGSPITDSHRTAATTATTRSAVLVYAPADYAPATLQQHAETMAERVVRYCGGRAEPAVLLAG